MTDKIKSLVERLRSSNSYCDAHIYEAADLIEQQAARIAELEAQLVKANDAWLAMSSITAPVADSAMAKDADLLKMIDDLEAEQTFISSCRERCDPDHELPRWDRIQAVIDHLKSQQRG